MKKTVKSETVVTKKGLTVPYVKMLIPVIALIVLGAVAFGAYLKFGVVAVVNGRQISRIDYIRLMEKQVGKQSLDQLVSEEMILDEAEKQGVAVDIATINSEIDVISKNIEAQGQTLEAALTSEGMNRMDLERQIRIRFLAEKLSGDSSQVTDEEIAKFLADNKALLPADATKEELNEMAKEELLNQKEGEKLNAWLKGLEEKSTVVYR